MNSYCRQDIQPPTELYDPEDPSIDDDLDQKACDTGESPIRKSAKDVSVPANSNDTHEDGEFGLFTCRASAAGDLAKKTLVGSIASEQHIGGSAVEHSKLSTTKSVALDMFSCDGDVTVDEKLEIEESSTIRSFDSRLNRLLDSGMLNIPLTLSSFAWKSKRSKKSQIPTALLKHNVLTDEEVESVSKGQLFSSVCVPPVVMADQFDCNDAVISTPPKFLKPPEDDEEEGQVFSPPQSVKSDEEDFSPNRPRLIRLTRDSSLEEPDQDVMIDSTLKPPRVIRLDRVHKRTPSPAIHPDRATSPAEVTENSRLISGDTPAEPLRIIRLNRDGSPQEKPRIIQLDRVPKSNSESAVLCDELDSSTDDLRLLIEQSLINSKRRRSPRDKSKNKSKCRMEPDKNAGSPDHEGRDRDQERKSGKVRSVDESKKDELRSSEKKEPTSRRGDEKYYETSSKKSESHHLDSRDRKRQLVDDKPPTKENHDISKRHKYDDLTPESEGKTHQRKSSKKRHHQDKSKSPESRHDLHGSKHKKHRQTDDDDKHKSSNRGARGRRSESHHSRSSHERDRSSRRHRKRSKSKEKTTDLSSSRNKTKHDKERREVDSNPVPAASSSSVRESSRSPHKKHRHSRGSRSRSRKHKNKTHRRKHKRSRSRSENLRVNRSVSNSRQREKSKKNKSKKRENVEHHDESATRQSSSTRRHSEQHHDRSIEEKEKSVLSHVNHSSSHVHAENYSDQERKHSNSNKQSTGKDLDSERSLSLLEVCMKTKYGQDFDPIVLLQAKHQNKSHSDDDVEILGVTYGTDEELPESCKFSSLKKIRNHRKKDSSCDNNKSSSNTMENEPVLPEKVIEHDINDDFDELQFRTSQNEAEEQQSDRNSDSDRSINLGMAEEFTAEKMSSEDGKSGRMSPAEQADRCREDSDLREVSANSPSIVNRQTCDVDDTVFSEAVDDQHCNKFEEATTCRQTRIPSKSDQNIPGICEDGKAASQPSDFKDSMLTRVVAAAEEICMISSPEPENNSSEAAADMDYVSQMSASVLVVPLERIIDESFSPPESDGNESISFQALPVVNDAITTEVDTHAIDASHVADTPAVIVDSLNKVTSHVENVNSGAAYCTSIEKSRFSPIFVAAPIKHNDIVPCDIQTKVLRSNSGSSPLYSSNIMSSSRIELAQNSANGPEIERDDDDVNRVATISSSIALSLPTCSTTTTIQPQLSLPGTTSLSVVVPNAQIPLIAAKSTLPLGFQAAPALGGTHSTRFALPSTPLPLLPRPQLHSLPVSSSHTSSPRALLSTAIPTLPSIIQSLFIGNSSVLQSKTVEDLQRLSKIFQNPLTVSSSSNTIIRDSVSSLPLVSAPSKTTSARTSVISSNSGPTMASQLIASLINLSKSSKSSASVAPPMSTSRAAAIDFNTDDVASPKSDESVSFSPPPSIPAAIVPQLKQQKAAAKTKRKEPELAKKSSESEKIEKKPVNKNDTATKIAADFKPILKPYYSSGKITKEEYKEIMRKAVPQISQSRSGDTSKTRMSRYADAYVNKVLLMRKYLAKKNKTQQQPPASSNR